MHSDIQSNSRRTHRHRVPVLGKGVGSKVVCGKRILSSSTSTTSTLIICVFFLHLSIIPFTTWTLINCHLEVIYSQFSFISKWANISWLHVNVKRLDLSPLQVTSQSLLHHFRFPKTLRHINCCECILVCRNQSSTHSTVGRCLFWYSNVRLSFTRHACDFWETNWGPVWEPLWSWQHRCNLIRLNEAPYLRLLLHWNTLLLFYQFTTL